MIITSEFEYKLSMTEFTPDEFGGVVAEANQLVAELNSGEADLPGDLDRDGARYWSKLDGLLFLVLGINRPMPDGVNPWARTGEEIYGLRLAFESRLSLETGLKVADNLQKIDIGSRSQLTTLDTLVEPTFEQLVL